MKKKKFSILSVIILLLFILLYMFFIYSNGFDITIKNKTNVQIDGLRLTYNGIKKDIEIPSIKSNAVYSININPQEEFGENSMKIYYMDKLGNRNEETIIGYFEKGYSGKVFIDIVSIDLSEKITFKVTEKMLE